MIHQKIWRKNYGVCSYTSEDLNSCRSVSEEAFFDGFENNLNSENFEENFDMPIEEMPFDDFNSRSTRQNFK